MGMDTNNGVNLNSKTIKSILLTLYDNKANFPIETKDILVEALKLKPVEFGGNVYLVTPSDEGVLFDAQQVRRLNLVSNLQLYLDLFNYPMRGREQAEHLREKVMRF